MSGKERKGNALFNDALNTFYLRLYGVGYMVKDHSDSETGNPLPPHRLLFPIILYNRERKVLFNDALLSTVIWRQTYG